MVSATEPSAGTARRRRSLFAAFFGSSASTSSSSEHRNPLQSSQDLAERGLGRRSSSKLELNNNNSIRNIAQSRASTGERRLSLGNASALYSPGAQSGLKNRAAQLVADNDIVMVAPREAKCVEARIGAPPPPVANRGASASDNGAAARLEPPHEAPEAKAASVEPSVMQRLLRRMRRNKQPTSGKVIEATATSPSASSSTSSNSSTSYLNELNERVELEKMRFLRRPVKHKRNSVPPNLVLAAERAASESPQARAWQLNENYVPMSGPRLLEIQEHQGQVVQSPARPGPFQACAKSASVEQFLASHRLRFDSLSSLATTDEVQVSPSSNSSSSSLCCSGASNNNNHNHHDQSPSCRRQQRQPSLQAKPKTVSPQLSTLSALEPDQRLLHWQSLAASAQQQSQQRSSAKRPAPGKHNAGGSTSESSIESDDDDDDDEDQEADSSSLALVCYCSDDTSCSSLELVWSRPQLVERRQSYRQQQAMLRNLDSTRVRPVRLTPSPRPPSRSSPVAAKSAPLALVPQRVGAWQSLLVNQGKPKSTGQQEHQLCMNRLIASGVRQHAAVLELAKPSRARDRRLDLLQGNQEEEEEDAEDYVRWRSREQRLARRKRRQETRETGARQAANTPPPVPQRPPVVGATTSDWVANPLFGPTSGQKVARRASCAELAGAAGVASADGPAKEEDSIEGSNGQRVDLTAKLNRCKELLRRLGVPPLPDEQQQQQQQQQVSIGDTKDKQHFSDAELGDQADELLELKEEPLAENELGKFSRHHQRWSLRLASPQQTRNNHNSLHQLLALRNNFDKNKLKSNVHSLKSQLGDKLSDTGKLASNLLTTIKDTTKEQIVQPLGLQPTRESTPPSSFATNEPNGAEQLACGPNKRINESDRNSPLQPVNEPLVAKRPSDANNNEKAKMFSLIYKHQQQVPAITKQPMSTAVGRLPGLSAAGAMRPASTRPVEMAGKQEKADASNGESAKKSRQALGAPPSRPVRRTKRLRQSKHRRQANVALIDESDEESADAVGPMQNRLSKTIDKDFFKLDLPSDDPRKHVTY